MNIAIVGAGIIGVTTAYELAADGHEVTVFERHGAAALETSFANAGVVAPGYVTPWAAPGMTAKVARYLFLAEPADETPPPQPVFVGLIAVLAVLTVGLGLYLTPLESWAASSLDILTAR